MRQWGLVAVAVLILLSIFRAPYARFIYLAAVWIGVAAGNAAARSESHGETSPAPEPFVPSGFVPAARGTDLNWSETEGGESPHFNFPDDPASGKGTAGPIHWSEGPRDPADGGDS